MSRESTPPLPADAVVGEQSGQEPARVRRSRPAFLPVHLRRVCAGDGREESSRMVFCAGAQAFVPLVTCLDCAHGLGIDGSEREGMVLICGAREAPHPLARRRSPGGADLATPVSAIMSRDVTCVTADLAIERLAEILLAHGFSGLPVVDAQGAAVGVVSKTDLLRFLHDNADPDEHEPLVVQTGAGIAYELGPGFELAALARATVGEIMTNITVSVPADASLGQAAALMASEGVHRVPVTDAEQRVVGLLSSLDVLRWLGRQAGYLITEVEERAGAARIPTHGGE